MDHLILQGIESFEKFQSFRFCGLPKLFSGIFVQLA
jgi:hypothetical protein